LLTFGGAYSNHIRATAAAARVFGFSAIGVIRGEEHRPLNPSLRDAVAAGMRLTYLDRAAYRRKMDPDVIAALHDRFGDFYLLPEGGSNGLAVRGCTRIPAEIAEPFDVICWPRSRRSSRRRSASHQAHRPQAHRPHQAHQAHRPRRDGG
jgi:1-aminocyclopropane-1-carboxylate deaminase